MRCGRFNPRIDSAGCAARRGFTLMELVLSIGVMSILLLGVTKAILIASRAVPAADSRKQSRSDAAAAVDRLQADLTFATSITELTSTAITFTVADRGHGAAGAETIRYAWSGTAGAPLTRAYNGSVPVNVVSSVTSLSITRDVVPGVVTSAPRVLLVVNSTTTMALDDTLRQSKLMEWGFQVTTISSSATAAQFNAAYANCDVLYIPNNSGSLTLATSLGNPSVGIVCESPWYYSTVGISSFVTSYSDTKLAQVDGNHVITQGMPADVTVTTISEHMQAASGTIAAGARTLAIQSIGGTRPVLVVLEIGGARWDGVAARGRRVALPWGGVLLDLLPFSSLTADARTILKRSLFWASSPPVYSCVNISLAVGTDVSLQTKVNLYNTPGVPKP